MVEGDAYEVAFDKSHGFLVNKSQLTSHLYPDQVLVVPKYVGICGTDLYLMETQQIKLFLGHEWVGEVRQVGSSVKTLHIGEIVTGTGHFACGSCADCVAEKSNLCAFASHMSSDKLGALRSHFVAAENQLQKIEAPLTKSQVLHEVFAVGEQAYELLTRSFQEFPDSRPCIFGAGPIGLCLGLVLRSYGHKPLLIEKNTARVARARNLGLIAMTLPEVLIRSELKSSFSILIDASNDYSGDAGAFRLLTHFAKKEFSALIIGKYTKPQSFPVQLNAMAGRFQWMRGVSNKTLKLSVGKWTPQLAATPESKLGQINAGIVTQVFPLDRVAEAFLTAQDKTASCKVVISLNQGPEHQ